jgi:hypothetical protein
LRRWWTESVLSVKAQKELEASQSQVAICSMDGQESMNNKSEIEQKSENTTKMVEKSTQTEEEEMAQSKQEIELPIINIKKSDDEVHQFIKSIETKNYVDDLLQVQQQEPQHQTFKVKTVERIYQVQQQQTQQSKSLWQQLQMKSSNITIKMMDIYFAEEKVKQSVITEIEGQTITQDADYMKDKNRLDQEQVLADSVSRFDTFRGGTEFN